MSKASPRFEASSAEEAQSGAGAARFEQVAFERLLADLSVRFANVSHEAIVVDIEAALGQLVEILHYDRCTYSELLPDGACNVVCSASAGGIEPLPRGPFGAGLPWLVGEFRAGRVVALADLPNGLPPTATAEAKRFGEIGLRSHLSIPLRVGGRVTGVLSFGGLRRARTWPEDVIARLKIIGEIIASGMVRARSEAESERLRSRLWHADRVARVGALTAAIAHEINQPLAAILSNAQAGLRYLDREQARPEDLRAILEAVVREDKRAAETIRTMRALLRHDDTRRVGVDLAAALREVLQLLAGELGHHGVRIETQFGAACWVVADKAQIEQVALNLILNATAAMEGLPRDESVLRVSVSRSDDRVVAELSDTGRGVAAADVEAIFEPFWTTRKEGLGLGLAICRSIVQAHGGSIRVAPNPVRGVTFRFELPAGSEESERPPAEPPARDVVLQGPARIPAAERIVCVVDDDASVRAGLERLLATAGWAVASFASARELLERQPAANIACLVLDMRMPDMSGPELKQHLADLGVAPPVVFLTGHGDVAAGIEAMKLGAVDYLVKPVEGETLIAAVQAALARGADARSLAEQRARSQALVARLSPREREIVAQVIRGRLNKQIAADLDIAEQTVKQHRGRVMEKLEVRSVAELVRICESAGVAPK